MSESAKVIPFDAASKERLESDVARLESLQLAVEDIRQLGVSAIAIIHGLGERKDNTAEPIIHKEVSDAMLSITEAASKYI